MRLPISCFGLGLILSMAVAAAQTLPQAQTSPINPSTPATHLADGAQSTSGTPVQPTTGASSTTGGVSGTANSSTAQTPAVENPTGGVSAMTDSDLQSQIQSALSKEPTLSGDSAHVNVAGDTIELAGAVGTNKEKITATRIVQSYAGSKKLVNRLTIGGRSAQPGSQDKDTATPKPPQR